MLFCLLEIGTAHESVRSLQQPPGRVAQYGPGKSTAGPIAFTFEIMANNHTPTQQMFNFRNRSITVQFYSIYFLNRFTPYRN